MFKQKRSFKREFRRQLRLAIAASVGFTIAFAWRNAIYDGLHEAVAQFTTATQLIFAEIYTAILITILGVMLLFITSKLLKE